jgi:hypothetical protein
MTPELKAELRQYAEARAKLVRRAGSPVSQTYARELVDDVQADIRIGALPWDPQCKLRDHLKAAIKKRTWLEIRHVLRITFVSLHEASNDETLLAEMEQALSLAPRLDCDPVKLLAITTMVCQQLRLRSLASGDTEAATIVRCWADGFTEKEEVMGLAGLTEAAYKSARRRLRRMIGNLASGLCEAAQDLLRGAA